MAAKKKPVTVVRIDRDKGDGPALYARLDALIAAYRPDLVDARIVLAWRVGAKPNADGLLEVGRCRRRSDVDRALEDCDFLITLTRDVWELMSPSQRDRAVYHEIMHAVIVLDEDGAPKRDQAGRVLTRIRRHDIELFRSEVEHFGTDGAIQSLSEVADTLVADREQPLLASEGPSA